MAATVAGPEPVNAANIAQEAIVTIPNPPGIHPNKLSAQFTILLDIPPLSINSPTNINNGTASKGKESKPVVILCGIKRRGFIPLIIKNNVPAPNILYATGTPNKIKNIIIAKVKLVIFSLLLNKIFIIFYNIK